MLDVTEMFFSLHKIGKNLEVGKINKFIIINCYMSIVQVQMSSKNSDLFLTIFLQKSHVKGLMIH